MAQLNWFETWFGTPYYHLLYNNRNEQEAQSFIDHLINHLNPAPGALMLDIACGNGRHARSLAMHGFDVTGIDISAASIAQAQRHEQEHLRFFIGDMRRLAFVKHFDFVFNMFTSFGYFEHKADDIKAAKAISRALKPGGKFIIDYLNTVYAKQNLVPQEAIIRGAHHYNISRTADDKYINKLIDLTDAQGGLHHFRERVQCFTVAELIDLFTDQGLSLVSLFGNYQLAVFKETESPRVILIFER